MGEWNKKNKGKMSQRDKMSQYGKEVGRRKQAGNISQMDKMSQTG
jgi:hypothetical protein